MEEEVICETEEVTPKRKELHSDLPPTHTASLLSPLPSPCPPTRTMPSPTSPPRRSAHAHRWHQRLEEGGHLAVSTFTREVQGGHATQNATIIRPHTRIHGFRAHLVGIPYVIGLRIDVGALFDQNLGDGEVASRDTEATEPQTSPPASRRVQRSRTLLRGKSGVWAYVAEWEEEKRGGCIPKEGATSDGAKGGDGRGVGRGRRR